jgi:CheY-like chemotaxis protein
MIPMPTILLIEDDDLVRKAIATMLAGRGYTVTEATDGDKGIRLFHTQPTDLVITDLVMPNKEGMETIMELRRDYPGLGIIAMTGHAEGIAPVYLKIAGALGANCTLRKPFDLPTLLAAVKKVLIETGKLQPV